MRKTAKIAWAFTTVRESYVPLLTALARESERIAGDFNAQAIANTVWAFATLA